MSKDTQVEEGSVAVAESEARATQPQASSQQSAREPQRQPGQIEVNDTKAVASYANFCRVTGTPEELIVDFGLNKQVGDQAAETIQLTQRIIVNFFTAKRLA
ncbi:DUF3467 domain-containing protein, partial [bacterium]|nr:DUF3467 domain-containing protein [bacterium]